MHLEEEAIIMRRKLSDATTQQQNQIELLKLRNKNLQELTKKYENQNQPLQFHSAASEHRINTF